MINLYVVIDDNGDASPVATFATRDLADQFVDRCGMSGAHVYAFPVELCETDRQLDELLEMYE